MPTRATITVSPSRCRSAAGARPDHRPAILEGGTRGRSSVRHLGSDLAFAHGAFTPGRLDPIRDLASLVSRHEARHLVDTVRTRASVREPEASEANHLVKVILVRHRFLLSGAAVMSSLRPIGAEQGSARKQKAAPWGGGFESTAAQAGWLAPIQPYAVWMVLTAILPERRSSAVSNETFWPSTRPPIPARSTAVAWTNTSLEPSSGWMKPKPFWSL